MLKRIIRILGIFSILLSISSVIAEGTATKNSNLSPQSLDLSTLRNLNALDSPMDKSYNYHEAFKKLDVNQLKTPIRVKRIGNQLNLHHSYLI